MDEKELLKQIAAMFHENNEVISQIIDERISASEKRMDSRISASEKRMDSRISASEKRMDEKIDAAIDESERRIGILIEQTVVKRIDSLFDGYVSTRERQELMQTQMDTLAARLETLELVVRRLEQKAS